MLIPRAYWVNRLLTFALTVWLAATLILLIPRFSPIDPAEVMLSRMATAGGTIENSEAILDNLRRRFGLDAPLPVQYLRYLGNLATFDLGVSTANFPTPVVTLIARALPWTMGLMTISVLLTFVIGNWFGKGLNLITYTC